MTLETLADIPELAGEATGVENGAHHFVGSSVSNRGRGDRDTKAVRRFAIELPRGASWGSGNQIVFSPGSVTALQSVSADTSTMRDVTTLSAERDEKSIGGPRSRRTGSRFDIEWVSLDSRERKVLVEDGFLPSLCPDGVSGVRSASDPHGRAFDPTRPDRLGALSSMLEKHPCGPC